MKTKISIIPCSSYEQINVDKSIEECFENFSGIEKFVSPGKKILIKPNILMEKKPEECVTTHPSIIRSVIRQVKKAGGIPLVGDSPGGAICGIDKVLDITGIKKTVLSEGGEIINFETEGIDKIDTDFNFLPHYYISHIVKEVDVIINLPKLKTHGLTKYTGAIKNMFGIVPGMHKPNVHRYAPKIKDFSEVIVDIFTRAVPVLNIMDAVYGMEGNGPSAGIPRFMGYIIAGTDAVALDAVCSYMIGYNVDEILTTVIANKRGLGEKDLNNIDIEGKNLNSMRIIDFIKPETSLGLVLPPKLLQFIYSKVKIKPAIDPIKCQKCLLCVKKCPVSAINFYNNKFTFDYDVCIECLCCHELCKEKAVILKKSLLAKLFLARR